MRRFTLNLADNPRGQDPRIGFFKAVTTAYPDLGLSEDKSIIVMVMDSATIDEPNRAFVRIQKDATNSAVYYDFLYNRFNVNDYIKNPYWTASEVTVVQGLKNSEALVAYVANKAKLNFTASDIWLEISNITYTGGKKQPNFLFKAIDSSLWWRGWLNLWLHSGGDVDPDPPDPDPDPDPEPTDGYQIFPQLLVPFTITVDNETGKFGNWICPPYDQAIGRLLVLMPKPDDAQIVESPKGVILPSGNSEKLKAGAEYRILNLTNEDVDIATAYQQSIIRPMYTSTGFLPNNGYTRFICYNETTKAMYTLGLSWWMQS
ncbi:TPA: hypothetical protein ACGJ7A_004679 [Pseudomonas aeruginosa]|uniref:Virion structural protein n=1 Tax=Pseudomonas phage vB_PaeM_FBPa36 TaxID=3231237 RepID=A0AAU8KT03_9VIRU